MSAGAYNYKVIRTTFELNWYRLMQKSEPNESILYRIITVDRMG